MNGVGHSFWAVVACDVREDIVGQPRADKRWRRALLVLVRIALAPRLQAVVLVRVANAAHRRSELLGAIVRWINHVLNGCDISPRAEIGPGLVFSHPVGTVIGPDVRIGARCRVMQGVSLGIGRGGAPTVHDDVLIAKGAIVYGGVTIGSHAKIAPYSVVSIDVPAHGFAAGNPAEILKVGDRRL
jgi:serine O-acetyltransferase